MYIRIIYCLIIISLARLSLFGQSNEIYNDSLGLLGIDENAGKNSFLSLLIPSGGKFEAMAGTHTAMAGDNSVLDSNPAGISFLRNGYLSFFHVDWISDSALETISYSFRGRKDESFGMAFNTRFFHVPFKGFNTLGETAVRNGRAAVGNYNEIISTVGISYKFFDNFYFGGLSVGGALKVGYRALSESIQENQNAFSIMGDFGIMTRFNFLKIYSGRDMNFSVGATAKNLGVEFIESPDPLPSYFSLGIGYKIIAPLTLTADWNLPFNLNGTHASASSVGVGINADIASFLSIQTGVLIKYGKPRFAIGTEFTLDTISLQANYTLDLLSQAELFDRFSISVKINMDKLRENIIRDKLQKIYLEGLDAYSQGKIELAIQFWEQCLVLDPNFTPASQMIETASQAIERQKKLMERIEQ